MSSSWLWPFCSWSDVPTNSSCPLQGTIRCFGSFHGLTSLLVLFIVHLIPGSNAPIEADWYLYLKIKCTNISSDNGLAPIRCQAIIWTNDDLSFIESMERYFSEICIKIDASYKNTFLKMSSAKWQPFCPSLDVVNTAALQVDTLISWRIHHEAGYVMMHWNFHKKLISFFVFFFQTFPFFNAEMPIPKQKHWVLMNVTYSHF